MARTRVSHCARRLSGGGVARELATRAHGTALVVVGTCPMKGHCASEMALCFGARPWCDLPTAASNTQPAFTWRTRERATALALSGEEARQARLATRARRAARDMVAFRTIQDHCTSEKPLSLGTRPCCVVPAEAANTQKAFVARRTRERATAPTLFQEEAHARLPRARAVLRARAVPR